MLIALGHPVLDQFTQLRQLHRLGHVPVHAGLERMRGISGRDIDVQVNPAFVRANEVKSLRGDNSKLRDAVGSLPDFDLGETLRWMYLANTKA